MLVTRQLPALFNGVSQQPAAVRSPSQWEDQVNATSSVVDGVRKRGPSEHVVKLTSDRLGSAALHTINRDITERYEVIVTPTGIRVFDLNGLEKVVTAPLGWGYLSLPAGATARQSYVMTTVADYTFVTNKTKVVEMLPVGSDLDPPTDDYWWLNRPVSSSPAAAFRYEDPEDDGIGGGGTYTPPPDTSTTTVTPTPTGTLKGTVQTLQDLPGTAVDGDVYKVVGTNESNFQSYYVIKSGSAWNETVLPGLKNLVDANTMPHALIRQSDGTFVFGPFAWSPRRVGDEATNPNPTFVGRTIKDIFFYRNRLGFCVSENVVLSRAGDFGNFYRLTVVDYLPDEVVDVAASETKVTKMEFAVPFQDSMMLFSDQTQFKLIHDQVFSGSTVSLVATTQYPAVPGVRPAQSGADVYFASQGSGYGQIREYFVAADNDTHDASNVSAHVPTYLPANIHQIVAAPQFDFVGVLADGEPSRIYVYQYYWESETEKAQSAWNYWELPEGSTILGAATLGGYLYLVVDRTQGTFLERIPLFYGSGIAGLPFQVYLDRRVEITGTYDAGTNKTTFGLPYAVLESQKDDFRLVLGNDFEDERGATPKVTWLTTGSFTVDGDRTAGPCAAGLVYDTRLTFSRQFPQNSRGEPLHTGRLQLKTFSVYHVDTAYFRAEIRPYGPGVEPLYTQEFPMRRLNLEPLGGFGDPIFLDDKASFGVQANASVAEVTIINDSHLGFCINGAELEGFYHNRARA